MFVQSPGNFPDPDSFYHAGMAELIREQGLPRAFPYLQFTALRQSFVDHHLLYHLILSPLGRIMDPLAAARGISIVFAVLAVITFFFIQAKKGIKSAPISTILLLVSSTWLLRINLAKGVAPVIIIFLLLIYALFERKRFLIFALCAAYPWLYAGWPLSVVLIGAEMASAGLLNVSSAGSCRLQAFFGAAFDREQLKSLGAVIFGLTLGLTTNPYFPKNIWFTWLQAIKIGLVNYQKKIPVGLEWYPYNYGELISILALPLLFALVAAIALFFSISKTYKKPVTERARKMARESLTLAILTGLFFILTVKSKRSAEYFIPLFLLTASWCMELALRLRGTVLRELRALVSFKLCRAVFIYLALAGSWIAGRDILAVRNYFKEGFSPSSYKDAAMAIRILGEPGDIVFHSDWDDFPLLFYWNREQYYLAGLDPTFFYEYDPIRYSFWREATAGSYGGDLHSLIKDDFGAKFVFTDHKHKKLQKTLRADSRFELMHDDADGSVYRVK